MGLLRPHDRHGTADGGAVGTQFLLPRHCAQVQLGCTQIRNPAHQCEQSEHLSKIEALFQREICLGSGSASGCASLVRNDGGGNFQLLKRLKFFPADPLHRHPGQTKCEPGSGPHRTGVFYDANRIASAPGQECSRPGGRVTDQKKGRSRGPFSYRCGLSLRGFFLRQGAASVARETAGDLFGGFVGEFFR
jgi:hypothetical protein